MILQVFAGVFQMVARVFQVVATVFCVATSLVAYVPHLFIFYYLHTFNCYFFIIVLIR